LTVAVPTPEYSRRPIVPTKTPTRHISNFTQFFAVARDIYVQNLSSKQVSMQFELPGGGVESFLVPALRDPINLTQYIPFDAIKNSVDLRKMLMRSPPILALLSEDEYGAYYAQKAQKQGFLLKDGKTADVGKAIQVAEGRAQAIRNHMPIPNTPAPTPIHKVVKKGGAEEAEPEGRVLSEEVVRPRVLHLVNMAGNPQLADKDRMPVGEFLEELEQLPDISMDEYEYIRAHGFFKTVKRWATQKMAEIAPKEE
jgi:hypothetical protein